MTAVPKAARVGFDAISAQRCVMISELFSGDSFGYLDPVYIDSAGAVKAAYDDSTGAKFDGFASVACDSVPGHPVTILGSGLIMEWLEDSDAMTPGTLLYVGGASALETTGTTAVAKAISRKEIIVL
jgi:hypothetical protein